MKAAPNRMLAVGLAVLTMSLLMNLFPVNSSADEQSQTKPQLQKPKQQEPKEKDPQDDQGPVVKLGTALVVLDVTVVDQSNNPVMDMAQNNFQVFEDKIPQEIKFFTREQVPVSLVFTIDTSG